MIYEIYTNITDFIRKLDLLRIEKPWFYWVFKFYAYIVRKQFSNLPSVFTYPQDIFAGSFSRFVQTACRIFLQQFFLYQDNHVCQLFRYLLLLRLFQQILPDCLGSSAVFLFFRPSPFFCPLCLFFTYWSLVLCIFGGAGDDQARVKFFSCIRLIFVKKRPLSFLSGLVISASLSSATRLKRVRSKARFFPLLEDFWSTVWQ